MPVPYQPLPPPPIRFELTLKLTHDGWLTSSLGVFSLTVESLQLAVDFPIAALSTHPIAEVKRMIQDHHGIPVADQELMPIVDGDTKNEADTLVRRSVSDGSHLKLKLTCSLPRAEPQPIHVKTLTQRVFSFNVTAATTVYNLKELIRDTVYNTMPEEQQCLIFAGKMLEDQRTLREYNVWRGAELFLVPQAEWHVHPPMSCTKRAGIVPWYDWSAASQVHLT